MLIPGVTDIKCAILIDSLDEYGKNLKRLYYGENGKLGNIDEGIAVSLNSYDCFGRLVSHEVFDKNGKAVCGKTIKYHKYVISYNEKGLIREIACFDEKNAYINTPMIYGYCREIRNYDERGNININKLKRYYSLKGEAVDEKKLNAQTQVNTTVERISRGSLILANAELPGLFIENGYEGLYCVLEWNEWNMYDTIEKFLEVFNSSSKDKKHLLIVPVKNGILGNVIDVSFPPGILGVRLVDSNENPLFNELINIYERYKNTHYYPNYKSHKLN